MQKHVKSCLSRISLVMAMLMTLTYCTTPPVDPPPPPPPPPPPADPLSAVAPMYPASGASRLDQRVTFFWDPAAPMADTNEALVYEIEINGQVFLSNDVFFTRELSPGTYNWRARAISISEEGDWSDMRVLQVNTPPSYAENSRTAFFDDLLAKTQRRTAWSDRKWQIMGTTFERELELHHIRAEFSAANTREKMQRALHKFNYIRKDRHLYLGATDIGTDTYAPIRFYPDFSDATNTTFFAANFSQAVLNMGVSRGDRLLAVNGVPVAEYVRSLEVYLRFSTLPLMYMRELADDGGTPGYLSAKNSFFGDELYPNGNQVKYLLESQSTGEWREITLNYTSGNVSWLYTDGFGGSRSSNANYYRNLYQSMGFTLIEENIDAALYINDAQQLLILEWYDFEDTQASINDVLSAAASRGALGYDMVIDATHSSGGSGGAQVVRGMSDSPFKVTFGNVRVTDTSFANANKDNHGSDVEDWIDDAIDQGRDYTTNEPFKLRDFPRGSDGIMNPTSTRFTGKRVLLLFPWGGSHLDQFAAMIGDNAGTGIHTMGMQMGGYSNTWEWGETINVPEVGNVAFEWNIGHTIRPNGEVLEGNPFRAADWYPMTRHNHENYLRDLVQRGIDYVQSP